MSNYQPHTEIGLYTVQDVARMADMPNATLYRWVARGKVSKPTNPAPRGVKLYYSEDELPGLLSQIRAVAQALAT